jgi:hypothetical protein
MRPSTLRPKGLCRRCRRGVQTRGRLSHWQDEIWRNARAALAAVLNEIERRRIVASNPQAKVMEWELARLELRRFILALDKCKGTEL